MNDAPRRARPLDRRDAWVARKVNGERVVLLGWATAILMQFAHPKVAAGIAEHTTAFTGTSQWVRRSLSTINSMLGLTFGDDAQAARTIAKINAIHRRVHGVVRDPTSGLPPGTPYSAEDPALLCWVHVTLEYAFSRAYELFVGSLTMVAKDHGCAESVETMTRLGIPETMLPTTLAEVYARLGATMASGDLVVGRQARALARQLLAPPLPGILQPLLLPARLTAIGLLPPPIRAAYGFHWSVRHEFALRLFGYLVRHALPLLPASVRYWRAARPRRPVAPLVGAPMPHRGVA